MLRLRRDKLPNAAFPETEALTAGYLMTRIRIGHETHETARKISRAPVLTFSVLSCLLWAKEVSASRGELRL